MEKVEIPSEVLGLYLLQCLKRADETIKRISQNPTPAQCYRKGVSLADILRSEEQLCDETRDTCVLGLNSRYEIENSPLLGGFSEPTKIDEPRKTLFSAFAMGLVDCIFVLTYQDTTSNANRAMTQLGWK